MKLYLIILLFLASCASHQIMEDETQRSQSAENQNQLQSKHEKKQKSKK